MNGINKIKKIAYTGTSLAVSTFVLCVVYSTWLDKFLDPKIMVSILALLSVVQGLLANIVYRTVRNYSHDD